MSKNDILADLQRLDNNKKKALKKPPPIPCKGYEINSIDYGKDYDCEYPYAGEILCEDCVINGGKLDPRTGRKYVGVDLPENLCDQFVEVSPSTRFVDEDCEGVGLYLCIDCAKYSGSFGLPKKEKIDPIAAAKLAEVPGSFVIGRKRGSKAR